MSPCWRFTLFGMPSTILLLSWVRFARHLIPLSHPSVFFSARIYSRAWTRTRFRWIHLFSPCRVFRCISYLPHLVWVYLGWYTLLMITYLISSTNQTTLENLTPFILLRHLPPLPRSGHSLSDPPLEPELSSAQRRMVKDAHGQIFLYDIGFRKNWAQVFGWRTKYGWLYRLWCGGAP